MVHLTFDLNTTADINRNDLFKAINDFIFHHHRFIPHDTYITECLRRGQSATSLVSRLDVWGHDWNEYVRDPDHFGRTDDWGRKQCYYEWGWKTSPDAVLNPTLRGHSRVNEEDDAISSNYPLHPADIIYELRIRKLTEWGIREVEELRTFADKAIRRFGAEYKPHSSYTDSEVADWIDMVDYAQNQMTLMCSQQMEDGTDKKAWICRCCKMCHLADGTGSSTDDHGANPFPLYSSEFKVCQDCDRSFVLPLRMFHASGKNGSKQDFHFLQKESAPFYYPKPEGWKPCPNKREDERNFGKFFTHHQVSGEVPVCKSPAEMDYDSFNCPWEGKERTHYEAARQTEKMVRNKLLGYVKEANDKGGFGISPKEHKRILRETLAAKESDCVKTANECVAKAVEEVKKEYLEEFIETQMMTARSVEVWKEIEAEKKEIKKFAEQGRSAVKTLSAPLHQKSEALKKEIANRDNLIQDLKAQLVPFNQHPKLSQVIRMKAVLKQWGKCYRLEVVGKDVLTYGPGGKYPVRADEVGNIVPKKSIAPPQKQKKKKVVEECPCVICEKQFPRKSLIEKGGDLWCRKCQ